MIYLQYLVYIINSYYLELTNKIGGGVINLDNETKYLETITKEEIMNDFDNFMEHYRDILNMYNDESDKVYNEYIKALDKVNEIKDKELSNYQRDYNRIASDVEKEREEEYDRLDYKYGFINMKPENNKQPTSNELFGKTTSELVNLYQNELREKIKSGNEKLYVAKYNYKEKENKVIKDNKYVISKIKETKQESDKHIDAKYKSIIYMYETKIEELERDMKAEREKKVKKSYFRNFFSK
jgi:hypothetical protein